MPNDDELALFSQLDDVFANVDSDEVEDFQSLTVPELIDIKVDMEEKLKELQEVLQLETSTREGRDAHSRLYAVQLELRRRGF